MMLINFLVKRAYRTNVNTIQWNKTFRTHQINGNHQQALKLFQIGIEKKTFQPNSVTYLTILDSSKELTDDDVYNNPRIRSLLMDVYIKCQDPDSAYRVFQSMKERNLIDYCGLMTAFNNHGQYEKTFELSKQIPSPNKFSSPILCTLMLQACTELKLYDEGCKIHQNGKHLISNDQIFMNELLSFYLKFDKEKEALDIFEKYHHRQTVIQYSLLMKYYNRQYQPEKTIDLYNRLLQNSHIQIDHIVCVLVLQAIANGCCVHASKQIRDQIKKFGTNVDINNALINMYGN
jgi:pentatricopeptide repeat protein